MPAVRLSMNGKNLKTENGAFRECSSNRRNLKSRLRVLAWMESIIFENGAFRKQWRHHNHVISLTEFSSSTNPK